MLDEIIGMLEENRDLEQAEIEKYRNRMNSLSIKEASKCLSKKAIGDKDNQNGR